MTIRRIVVAGGGTAGWMSASALIRFLPADYSVTLVESEAIGTVGVGEATIPPLADFNHMLGIDENEFLRATGGTFKLGIGFSGWRRAGDTYFHPFSAHGIDIDGVPFHHYWLRAKQLGDSSALDDYAVGAVAATNGRFIRPRLGEPDSPLGQIRHAYHIDAGRYAAFLRNYAETRGVSRIEGKITGVEQNGAGDISALRLDGGSSVEGDFFIDCSGFRALLIGETLGSDFVDWSHWLPCDRAIAVPSAASADLMPATQATADCAGWRWRIPLQHRTGNGHVYSSAYIDDEKALDALIAGLDTPAIGEPNFLRFTAGCRRSAWRKNCAAIGLSGGFIEPLESTSIHMIQEGISRLLALFPGSSVLSNERDAWNEHMNDLYDYIRDFVILHYRLNQRSDDEFWRDRREAAIPDSLAARMDMYAQNARIFPDREDLFTTISWVAVMNGQGLRPHSYDPLAARMAEGDLREMLNSLRSLYREAADRMPPHEAFIERFCRMADLGEDRRNVG